MSYFDYILVGSGIAGLYTALLAKEQGSVLIVTKSSLEECNTRHAQGGIAAPIGVNDSPALHIKDTIAAGAGLCDAEAVRILATEAPDRIADLVRFGVPFDTQEGKIALTMEAAHSVPRILHAGGDATGEHIEVTLSKRVRASHIRVMENHLALEILLDNTGRVKGIKTQNTRTGAFEEFECRWLILATGGAGQLYKFNTNSAIATGDGIALAYEVGAEITDVEFFQFHPTALHLSGVPNFLISEAVRGEGGVLRNVHGYRFMPDYTPDKELAPRDVVARSIVYEMEKTGAENVFIDVTHLPRNLVTTRFPNIYQFCLEYGLDITKEMVPVAPAAHYFMGGVKVNTWGETNIPGLFAAGETACTGVHGANRLASNSMLEVLVFSKRILDKTRGNVSTDLSASKQSEDEHYTLHARKLHEKVPEISMYNLKNLMWENVGIIRNKQSLVEAANILATWQKGLPLTERVSYELSNMILIGQLIAEAALIREESRGAHFRTDFPATSAPWQHHLIFTKS